MIENENQQGQMPPQGKLVLPAYPDEEPYAVGAMSGAYGAPTNSFAPPQPQVRPDQLIQHRSGAWETHSNYSPAPKNPLAKIGYYWRKDPAYKVLMIAAVLVIAAGFIFVSLATAAFVRNPNFFSSNNNTTPQNPTESTPAATVDLRPTFPTPGGGSGGNSSSQPPAQSTPVLRVTATPGESTTPTPQPSPTSGPGGGTLTVQITNIPGQVSNNSTVQVDVATNEPGVTVRLQVSYNAYPFYYQSGAQVTGGDGNATLDWNVQVSATRAKHVVARVTAVATDANGQYVTSATYIVQVTSGFGEDLVL